MSLTKKYQLPVYDPPASYTDFNGGINTSLSNETLQPNELRDGLNCHYSNSALINRPGASLIKRLHFPLETNRCQGDFVYATDTNSWVISVRNGHIFYGIYGTNLDVYMDLLPITIKRTENFDDTENYLANLETKTSIDYTLEHEGFIYRYPKDLGGGANEEPSEPSEPEEPIEPIEPPEAEGPETEDEIEYTETLIIQNTKRVQGIPVDDYFLMATGTRILKIREDEDENGSAFLYGEILDAVKPSAWEYHKIGANYLSPFPMYHIDEDVDGTPTTEIGFIMTEPKELALDQDSWEFRAIISSQVGYDKTDFYYKWEVKLDKGTDWKPLLSWNAELNTDNKSSKGQYIIVNRNFCRIYIFRQGTAERRPAGR